MGRKYFDQRLGVPVNTASLSSAAVTPAVGHTFVTVATSGKSNDVILPITPFKGAQITLVVDNQTTSAEANINTPSTGNLFWGTTNNTATIVVTSTNTDNAFIEFSAASSQWAVTDMSSTGHWAFSLTTGSTGQ